MNELSQLTGQHYEKNEASTGLVSKVATILDSLPQGFSLGIVMGPRFGGMSVNVSRNTR